MTTKRSFSRVGGGHTPYGESSRFDPTSETMEFSVLFNDPEIRHHALLYGFSGLEAICGKYRGEGFGPRFSKPVFRRWVAKNLWAYLRRNKWDPGIGVRSVSQAPGFAIHLDIEVTMDVSGEDHDIRILVEETRPGAFDLNIVAASSPGGRHPVPKSTFGVLGSPLWSRRGTLQ